MKVTLTEETGWKGIVYLPGEVDIPEELAIALGHHPPPKSLAESQDPDVKESESQPPDSIPPTPAKTTRRK